MVGPSRFLSLRAVELLVVALVGAGLALGGAALLGKLGDHTTTTVEQVTPSVLPTTSTTAASTKALTPEAIYRQDGPGVVQITATSVTQSAFLPATQTSKSQGSGFVLDRAGHIITNFHVISGAQKVQVSFSGQDQLPATVVGKDRSTDLAVLKIDAHARALTPLPLGDSSRVVVGEPVAAIGSPFGNENSLTVGVVSATQRSIESLTSQYNLVDAIQVDAPINHGNSGGPLFDAAGRVIGINAQIRSDNGSAEGVGFAVPINAARRSMQELVATGKVAYAYVGITSEDLTPGIARRYGYPVRSGAVITSVRPGSPGAHAGLRGGSQQRDFNGSAFTYGGDVVVSIGGSPVRSASDVVRAVTERLRPGQTVPVTVVRDGARQTVQVTLANRPRNPDSGR